MGGPMMQMGLVADEWVTTVVDVSEHLEKAYQAVQCHKTQWPPERMEMMRMMARDLLNGRNYLRLAMGGSENTGRIEQDIID
jgi:LmbE family N-acetylglucosaminyl deacetylase